MLEIPLLEWLEVFAVGLRLVLESVSVVCVAIGFLVTLRQTLSLRLSVISQGRTL